MNDLENLVFTNSYARMPEAFHVRLRPTPLRSPHLVGFNPDAAALLDLDPVEAARPEFLEYFSGRIDLPGSEPVATLYAGHQFGRYVPQLGDGRALLLGEVRNSRGERWELQLKGAGLTPFSRDGDGRAVLRSTIREYLGSEAMHGLGIPTTRALCMVGSEEEVYRERIETGAMLVRLSPSHVRFGTFEAFYYRGEFANLRRLADYVIEHDYPELLEVSEPYLELLRQVVLRTARLIARWQLVGFAHGVMNTDNMSVLGLTLDYGPFGFMDAYEPGFVCNHSDHWGRYAFDRQPQTGLWNLSCFAQSVLPLLDAEDGERAAERARDVLAEYEPELERALTVGWRAKLGLRDERPDDRHLADRLLQQMARGQVDYTNLFRALCSVRSRDRDGDAAARDLFPDRAAFDRWVEDYRARLGAEAVHEQGRQEGMRAVNPKFVLRNFLAQNAIERAEAGDFSDVERLRRLLQTPFAEHPGMQSYASEPPDWGRRLVVSCSS